MASTMFPSDRERRGPLRLSVIVPFHKNVAQLRLCLTAVETAVRALPPQLQLADLIVAADGAVDDPTQVASEAGARLLVIEGPRGPAVARSRAATTAGGDVLVFVDADVVVHADALGRLGGLFVAQPDLGAAFGAYDEDPADPGFVSRCRNLGHAFIHKRSNRDAHTFWAGLGAVRARVFAAVGGFDERFTQPSVEDIDLGYRIHAAGYRIVLDPTIQGKHLKRWTFFGSIVTDIRDRGIPWAQLLNRYGNMRNDLNISLKYRACVVVSYLLVVCLIAALWWPVALAAVPVAAIALWLLDREYYQFLASRGGLSFALRWFPLHIVHHLCNGVSFVAGNILDLAARRGGLPLPGALPSSAWPGLTASSAVEMSKESSPGGAEHFRG